MSLENASAKSQTQNAWGHAALNAFPGVHTKIKGAALREYVKAKSKRDLLSPVYDKAIGFGETVTEFVSGWGMDMALDQGAQKKEKGKEED